MDFNGIKESLHVHITVTFICELKFVVNRNLPNPPVLLCCVHLEIEGLNKNIGRWETTWFNCHILHFKCFNLVGYKLYQ